jgi:hypothetical protein
MVEGWTVVNFLTLLFAADHDSLAVVDQAAQGRVAA